MMWSQSITKQEDVKVYDCCRWRIHDIEW